MARYDARSLAAIAFLTAASALLLLSLVPDGYVLADRRVLFLVLGVGCLATALAIARAGRLSGVYAAGIVFAADVAVVVAGFGLAAPADTRTVASVFTLPTMFIAVFMAARWVLLQGVVVVAGTWTVFTHAGVDEPVRLLHTFVILVVAVCPAVVVALLRTQVDDAIRQATTLATTDPLTGLANRRGLDERYPSMLARSRRAGLPIGVIVADLDHFKRVNDVHGHGTGDEVLRLVAGTVTGCVRGDDLVVRLGGEEIAVVAVLSARELIGLAERLRAAVETACVQWGVTVSLGVAWRLSPDGTEAPDRLLWGLVDEADDRMYAAKRAGRNRVGLAS